MAPFPAARGRNPQQNQQKKTPRQGGPGFLEEVDFLDVIRLTPLVSIDLIVNDGNPFADALDERLAKALGQKAHA